MRPLRTTARVLLSGTFLASGARAVAFPDRLTPQAKRINELLVPPSEADSQQPLQARTLVRLHGVLQLGAAVLLASGHLTRPAAAVLAASLIPATIVEHPFWTYADPSERHRQQLHFLKNLGLLGGLLLAASDTQGQPSLSWRAGRFIDDRRKAIRQAVNKA